MDDRTTVTAVIEEARPAKLYSSSILRVARHFWTVGKEVRATFLADELQRRPQVAVVAVLDGERRPVGLVRRDRLFSLLGKPFGREVLGRTPATELAEPVPVYDAQAGVFSVAAEFLADQPQEPSWCLLEDAEGRFQGALSAQDLASWLSRMTQEDIALAGELQERFQAGNDKVGGASWSFSSWSRAAKGIGGDFCFARDLGGGRAFVALCDVSGKGVAASLVVSMVWGMLSMYDYARGLPGLLRGLNESLVSTFHLEKYLTGYFAVYDPGARSLAIADMGHSHAILFRGGKSFSPRSGRLNLPLGIERDLEPSVARLLLEPGDRLLVFSDGITEQENAGGEEFGARRLSAAAAGAAAAGQPFAEAIPAAVDAWRGRTPQQDDMSFMLLSQVADRE